MDDDGGDVTLTASESAHFDLVIGADGMQSRVRALAFPDAPSPQYVGQCVWRARVPRGGDPCLDLWIGTRSNTGRITVDDDTSYLFCLVPYEVPPRLDPEDGVVLGQELAGTDEAREALARFSERRFERCRMVVEGGVQISRWQQSDDSFDADQGRITNEIWAALAEPA